MDRSFLRWVLVAIVSAFGLALQTTVIPLLAIGGCRPEVPLVLVVFWAWHVPYPAAVAIGGVMGVAAGCLSAEPMGLYAGVYAGVALVAYAVRDVLFLRHLVTQVAVTGIIAAAAVGVWSIHVAWFYPLDVSWSDRMLQVFGTAAYTGAVGPLVHRPLLRAGRLFGLVRPRYGYGAV